MAGKINVFGLGEHGINRVKSPIHVIDGELLNSQNAVTSPVGAQLGLKKRDGMAKINSVAAAGSILSINNIPFANPTGLGISWSSSSTGLDLDLLSIAWSPTLAMFVAVGFNDTDGNAARSTDGINWTAMTIEGGKDLYQVIWADGDDIFVASGDPDLDGSGAHVTSSDGTTWVKDPSGFIFGGNNRVSGYSPDLDRYVTVPWDGTDSRFYYSSDVTNWTQSDLLPLFSNWSDVVWSPSLSLYAVVSQTLGTQQVMTSSDGIAWDLRTTSNSSTWQSIHWSEVHEVFVATAATSPAGTLVMTSTDGTTWTPQDAANDNEWKGIAESDTGRLVAVASTDLDGDQVMISTDAGVTWTTYPAAASRQWHDIAFSSSLGMFVAIARDGDPMYSF